jgi:surfactin synthase thioesterase subunit
LEEKAWLRDFNASLRHDVRLIVFPHAGGSASFFYPLSKALCREISVSVVQYPGRQDRRSETPLRTITDLVRGVLPEIYALDRPPTVLYGHSMGAVIAYEVARVLAARGTPPLGLIVSGRRAPSLIRKEYVHLRDDQGIIEAIQSLDGSHDQVLADPELRESIIPALRADYTAIETYQSAEGATLSCPVSVLTGSSDPMTSIAEAQAWRRHTTGHVKVQEFEGGHFFLIPNFISVCEFIRTEIISFV